VPLKKLNGQMANEVVRREHAKQAPVVGISGTKRRGSKAPRNLTVSSVARPEPDARKLGSGLHRAG
jgi:hypothetical protein